MKRRAPGNIRGPGADAGFRRERLRRLVGRGPNVKTPERREHNCSYCEDLDGHDDVFSEAELSRCVIMYDAMGLSALRRTGFVRPPRGRFDINSHLQSPF